MGRPFFLQPVSFGAGLIIANAITLFLALDIRRDFPPKAAMRTAWGLMAAAALCGMIPYAAMWEASRNGYYLAGRPQTGLLSPAMHLWITGAQATGVIATFLLLASLIRMRSSFVQLGLGTLRFTDRIAAAAIAAVTPLLFLVREIRPPEGIPAPLIDGLQRFDPLLIGGCAIACVVVVRVSRDIEGGYLAVSFYCVALLGLVRLLALVASMIPVPAIRLVLTAVSVASDWLITLAVYYRWQLAVQVNDMTARQQPFAGAKPSFPPEKAYGQQVS